MLSKLPSFCLYNFCSSFPLIWFPEDEHATCVPPQSLSCLELTNLELVVVILRILIISLYNLQFVCWLLEVNWMAGFANISADMNSHVYFYLHLLFKMDVLSNIV